MNVNNDLGLGKAECNKKQSRLGNLLVAKSFITEKQLEQALIVQKDSGLRLGEVLVREKIISRRQLAGVLCKQRWMRSAIASLVMAAMPVCPALAAEKEDTQNFTDKTKIVWGDGDSDVRLNFSPTASNLNFDSENKNNNFKFAIKHDFSTAGLEFSLNKSEFTDLQVVSPQISIFTSRKQNSSNTNMNFGSLKGIKRFDRYKNTIPTTYRLTLKGYSVYENNSKTVEAWGMNKVKNHPCKDYELMFSVTKQF